MKHYKIWYGFTLAEVLVTIGIIGVVAAMTIPTLMSRYRTFVLQQQFRKVYAAIAVAAEKVQYDMGENVKCFYGPGGSWMDCPLFYQELAKQLDLVQTCKGEALKRGCLPKESYKSTEDVFADNNPDLDADDLEYAFGHDCPGFSTENIEKMNTVYVLRGGFLLIMYNKSGAPVFIVDINGQKRPNKWGHDLFLFGFDKKKLYDSYFTLQPSIRCNFVEEDGYTTQEFLNRINRGTANF